MRRDRSPAGRPESRPTGRGSGRLGVTLIELVVSLLVATLLLRVALDVLVHARELTSEVGVRSQWLSARRAARLSLGMEARGGVVERDWTVFAPDSVRVRAFRGHGRACPGPGPGTLSVAYRGARDPSPEKDSVLILNDSGRWRVATLVDVREGAGMPCGVAEPMWLWRVEPAASGDVAMVRAFETVSFHLVDGALRLRPGGGGGRQPLTPELLSSASGFGPAERRVLVHLIAGEPGLANWSGALRGGG